MSARIDRARVREAMERAGDAWIFSYWGDDADQHVERIGLELEAFIDAYTSRFGEAPDPIHLLEVNPVKGKAFFQVDTLAASTEMKILVWRLLHGCEIIRVEFKYQSGQRPVLSVLLRSPSGQDEGPYIGQQPGDFRVLRHIGATGRNGNLVLEGYYATKPPQ